MTRLGVSQKEKDRRKDNAYEYCRTYGHMLDVKYLKMHCHEFGLRFSCVNCDRDLVPSWHLAYGEETLRKFREDLEGAENEKKKN